YGLFRQVSGNPDEARAHLERARDIFRSLGVEAEVERVEAALGNSHGAHTPAAGVCAPCEFPSAASTRSTSASTPSERKMSRARSRWARASSGLPLTCRKSP